VRDAALYAGQHNHFSARGIVLFTGGERIHVRPLFPWGSAKADRSVFSKKRKRPQEEKEDDDDGDGDGDGGGEGEGGDKEKLLFVSTSTSTTATSISSTSTAIPFADLDAILPDTPILTSPNFSDPSHLQSIGTNGPNQSLTALQLADLEAMGFSMVVDGTEFQEDGPRPDPQRSKALVALRERLGAEAAIFALGPVPVGSKYAGSVLLASGTIGPIPPGPSAPGPSAPVPSAPVPWDRGCLFSRSERQQISNLDGLSGQERKRHKRLGAAQCGTAQCGAAQCGAAAQNVLGRTNGCAFCKHGLVSAQGLARLYPRIKAYLAKPPFS
jgi:hypothetical protein